MVLGFWKVASCGHMHSLGFRETHTSGKYGRAYVRSTGYGVHTSCYRYAGRTTFGSPSFLSWPPAHLKPALIDSVHTLFFLNKKNIETSKISSFV